MHEERTVKGTVWITAARGNRRGGNDAITLTIKDRGSVTEVVRVDLTLEQWGQIVSGGVTEVDCATLYAGSHIGQKHVVERRLIPFGADAREYAYNGEVPDMKDSTNPHNQTISGGGKMALVAFHRWEPAS